MEAITKIYELARDTAKSFKMTTGKKPDGTPIVERVAFIGGVNKGVEGKETGKLATNDPILQEVIENHPLFNKEIFLRREVVAKDDQSNAKAVDKEAKILEDITSVSAAKIKLQEVFKGDIKPDEWKNMEAITEFCVKNNVKIPGLGI